MILALKYMYIQKVIKTYKTLVGALTHTCTLCTHLHYPQITPSPGKKNETQTFHWPLSGNLHRLNTTALFLDHTTQHGKY